MSGSLSAARSGSRTPALGVTLAAVNVLSLLPYRTQLHPLWLALTLVVAQAVPLTWRRSWPVPVMIVIGGARVAYDQIGFGFAPFPLGPAIAFYTVMDRSRPLWRWITAGGVAAGVAVSLAAPGHNEPYDGIFQALIFLTAWAAGMLEPRQAGQPAGGAEPGRPRRGRARPAGVARRGARAHPDRPRTARRRRAPRQPDGGAGGGGDLAAPGPARRRRGGRWRSSGTRPGWR